MFKNCSALFWLKFQSWLESEAIFYGNVNGKYSMFCSPEFFELWWGILLIPNWYIKKTNFQNSVKIMSILWIQMFVNHKIWKNIFYIHSVLVIDSVLMRKQDSLKNLVIQNSVEISYSIKFVKIINIKLLLSSSVKTSENWKIALVKKSFERTWEMILNNQLEQC